ncbi:MAG: D-alanyl-D-alanine carboxypeptidase family protein [Defluviicoccus sp.]
MTNQRQKLARRGRLRWSLAVMAVGLAAGLLAGLVPLPGHAIETKARQALLVDMQTGAVMFEKNADEPMVPASMTKIMTVYMLFDRLKKGELRLNDTMTISENAWSKGGAASQGSTMFLKTGDRVRVEDLLHGIIVQSGNDASIAVAEGLAGSESAFAEEMNRRAREIGMRNSNFRNASGLPEADHLTTARDLAVLAKRTIEDFPEFYNFYSEREFFYNSIRQGNRNPLLYKAGGGDGLKTGHTKASGYGLTASAIRGGRRLILIINGLASMQDRGEEAQRLLDYGFHEFENVQLFKAGEEVAKADVWYGAAREVALVSQRDILVTLPRTARPGMNVVVSYTGPVPAPIAAGQQLAILKMSAPGVGAMEQPLVAGAPVEKLGVFGRLVFAITHLVGSLAS